MHGNVRSAVGIISVLVLKSVGICGETLKINELWERGQDASKNVELCGNVGRDSGLG